MNVGRYLRGEGCHVGTARVTKGRPAVDKAKRDRDARRRVLEKGLLACYEIIDMIRKELAELDAEKVPRA